MIQKISSWMDRMTQAAGHPIVFAAYCLLVGLWLGSGPSFSFSNSWHLIANSPTTLITTALGFSILHVQNRDAKALHTKLDALIEAVPGADVELEGIEHADEEKIEQEHEKILAT